VYVVLVGLEPKYTKNVFCIKLVFLYMIRKEDLDLCRSAILTFEIIGAVREVFFSCSCFVQSEQN